MSTKVRVSEKAPKTKVKTGSALKRRQAPREKGKTTISAKNQVTIPVDVLHRAGMASGERVVVSSDGPGRVVFEAVRDAFDQFDGALTGAFAGADIVRLRDEWQR